MTDKIRVDPLDSESYGVEISQRKRRIVNIKQSVLDGQQSRLHRHSQALQALHKLTDPTTTAAESRSNSPINQANESYACQTEEGDYLADFNNQIQAAKVINHYKQSFTQPEQSPGRKLKTDRPKHYQQWNDLSRISFRHKPKSDKKVNFSKSVNQQDYTSSLLSQQSKLGKEKKEKPNVIEKELTRRGKMLRCHYFEVIQSKGESLDEISQRCLSGNDQAEEALLQQNKQVQRKLDQVVHEITSIEEPSLDSGAGVETLEARPGDEGQLVQSSLSKYISNPEQYENLKNSHRRKRTGASVNPIKTEIALQRQFTKMRQSSPQSEGNVTSSVIRSNNELPPSQDILKSKAQELHVGYFDQKLLTKTFDDWNYHPAVTFSKLPQSMSNLKIKAKEQGNLMNLFRPSTQCWSRDAETPIIKIRRKTQNYQSPRKTSVTAGMEHSCQRYSFNDYSQQLQMMETDRGIPLRKGVASKIKQIVRGTCDLSPHKPSVVNYRISDSGLSVKGFNI